MKFVTFMVRTSSSFKLFFTKVTKSWKKRKISTSFMVFGVPWILMIQKLSVVACTDEYWRRSAAWSTQGQNKRLLNQLQPSKEVQSYIIVNWLKLLFSAGIGTSLYKAHSCRSGSTSKAKVLGMLLKNILKRVQWSGASTWQIHYNKLILNNRKGSEFETVILNNTLN